MTIETFNHLEAVLWFAIGVGMLLTAFVKRSDGNLLKLFLIAAIAFMLFGVSDLIEAKTGAWWRPAELLMLKGTCVLIFIWCYFKGKKLSAKNT